MARIHVHDSKGNTLAVGEVSVNSRNYAGKDGKKYAGEYDVTKWQKPRIGLAGQPKDDTKAIITNAEGKKYDYWEVLSDNQAKVIMLDSEGVGRGTSIILSAFESFFCIASIGYGINNGLMDGTEGVAVPQGSNLELFKRGPFNWTAELIDLGGVRTTPVPLTYVPT
ncbi:MAG: hypothetical protein DRQ42_04985 [Gammaproteobacteria bacterium]|nr:MAG: hypothetical protein DRQ42_04985 [Gammaproteobacteria bacterium]